MKIDKYLNCFYDSRTLNKGAIFPDLENPLEYSPVILEFIHNLEESSGANRSLFQSLADIYVKNLTYI